MKIYTDIVSGDILISDAFTLKEVNDIAYEVDCAAAEKYNSLDDGVTQRNIVADSFGLQETFMDKQTWLSHIKDYTKKLLSFLEKNNPDRVKPFRERFPSHTKQLLADIEKSKFYTGRSNLGDGMICVLRYREDGKTPYFTFWKDGLKTNEA
ncbi:hypothetical protein N7450_009333 [Penicillium hetheringtonii]|uniref:Translationally-controlled tumor protein homolog n=1 Tax=Penicillium hetheringtonii TaxID=911720 RepID=A0AAD6DET8_9EURO|nr:hypothetical protein N7450_009333 [Penicillium hetheringtonii]